MQNSAVHTAASNELFIRMNLDAAVTYYLTLENLYPNEFK